MQLHQRRARTHAAARVIHYIHDWPTRPYKSDLDRLRALHRYCDKWVRGSEETNVVLTGIEAKKNNAS